MEVKNISKSYGEDAVLKDVSLSIPDGSTVLISGVSGRGKTTLLNIMMGIIKADSGEVVGVPENISAVFQENRLPADFLPRTCVRMTAPKTVSRDMINAHLAELGLGEHLEKPVKELSGGQQRRVAIARAVLSESKAIFMDEPFNGLDRETKIRTIEYIKKYTRGKTLIVVSHAAEDAELLEAKEIRI